MVAVGASHAFSGASRPKWHAGRTRDELLKEEASHVLVESIGLFDTIEQLPIGGVLECDGQVLLGEEHLHMLVACGAQL